MLDLVQKIKDFKMTRRSFIGWTSAAAATAVIPVSRGLVAKAETGTEAVKMAREYGRLQHAGITVAAVV